jgi:VanZ family protein
MARPYLPSDPSARRLDLALWTLTAACAGATLWFSFISGPPGAHLFPDADKVGHALAYGSTLVCFMFAAAWRPERGDGPFPRSAFPVAILAIAVGIVIEVLQGRYFHRDAQTSDVVAEVIGSFAAFALFTLVRRRLDRRPERASARHDARA